MKNNSINKEPCNGNIVITMNKILKATREKNSGSFFSKYRQLFRIFLGKFLDISRNFRDFSGNFLEKFQPILDRFSRIFPVEKNKKIIMFFYFREISCVISWNFREQDFWLIFYFLYFFSRNFWKYLTRYREIKLKFFSAEFRRINWRTFLLGLS